MLHCVIVLFYFCLNFDFFVFLVFYFLSGMCVSRPGLGLETDQDHFFEVLVLVLVSEGGLEQVFT